MVEDLGKISVIKFSIYGEELEKIAKSFDGCPLKDNDGNIIGKILKAEWDGEKITCEASLD